MKDVVSRILKEEEQLRARLAEAQTQAQQMVAQAKKQEKELLDSASSELKAAAERSRAEAERTFQAEKDKALADTRNEAVELREKRARDIPQLAEQIFNRVTEIRI
jgi:F0F1-type ATP synthase membrane subunit b/b'